MHEVVWAKQLMQLTGAAAYAQAAVLAVFMGGLALGSALFGRWVDADGRPLRAYVGLELATGLYCLVLPFLIRGAGAGYVALAPWFFESGDLKILARLLLSALVVLPPAVLMGATLPILARHLVLAVDQVQRRVGQLYALNSLGALVGAGVAGFASLPWLGVAASLVLASLLNLIAAALVVPAARRERASPPAVPLPSRPRGPGSASRLAAERVTLVALATSGFAAMGYEIVYLRIIALSFGGTTYSFTVMLMCFVGGIALGSALIAGRPVARPVWWFALSQLGVVVAFLASTPLASRLPYLIALLRIRLSGAELGFELFQLGKAVLCLGVLLLPTLCLGVALPLAARVHARRLEDVGARVGSTYAWNTAGNVLGVVVTSLVLIPGLGVLGAFHVNLALNAAAGLGLLLVSRGVGVEKRLAAAVAAGAVALVYLATGLDWSRPVTHAVGHLRLFEGPNPADPLELRALHPSASFAAWKNIHLVDDDSEYVLFFDEDAHASVAVWSVRGSKRLYVNAKPDASTGGSDMATQLLLAHAPLFLAPEARSVLVIGHGSGVSPGAALQHPIERLDIVEISRGVLAADAAFAEDNHRVLSSPRVRVYEDDGQSFLRAVPWTYDLILSQPSNPWIAGIAGLFTTEYFEAARSRLNPGGLFTLWFQQYEQSEEAVALVLRTLLASFPYAMVFQAEGFRDVIAVAGTAPIEPDFPAMERRFAEPAVREDLARVGIRSLTSLLTHHALSAERLTAGIPPGPLNTVAHQRLEYMAPRAYFERDASQLLDRLDPLSAGEEATDSLLDRYLAYRTAAGEPVSVEELREAARYARAAGGDDPSRARAVALRARRAEQRR